MKTLVRFLFSKGVQTMVSHFIFMCSLSHAFCSRHGFSIFARVCSFRDVSIPRIFAVHAVFRNRFPKIEPRTLEFLWSVFCCPTHFPCHGKGFEIRRKEETTKHQFNNSCRLSIEQLADFSGHPGEHPRGQPVNHVRRGGLGAQKQTSGGRGLGSALAKCWSGCAGRSGSPQA